MGWKRLAFETLIAGMNRFAPRLDGVPESPERILVLRNNDIGDLLVVTPLFAALRKRFPRTEILAGIGNWNRAVLKGNPHVDRIVPVNAPWHNQQIRPQGTGAALRYIYRAEEVRSIAAEHCTIGIDVLGSGFGSLLMMRTGIPWRLGVEGYAGGYTGVQQAVQFDPERHVGDAALEFARMLGARDLPENRPQIFLGEPVAATGEVVIAPGGGFLQKRWPLERFCELAAHFDEKPVTIIGGTADQAAGDQILARCRNGRNLAGQTNLRETFRIVAGARLVICNSSMAMHVAAAFQRPCLVLLGEHYSSAAQHARQWGYPETRVLGPEPSNPRIPAVAEAILQLEAMTRKEGEL